MHMYMYMYMKDFLLYLCPGLPWGVVASLPRSIQTLVAQLGVDRKSLSIIDITMRGMTRYTCTWMSFMCAYMYIVHV